MKISKSKKTFLDRRTSADWFNLRFINHENIRNKPLLSEQELTQRLLVEILKELQYMNDRRQK